MQNSFHLQTVLFGTVFLYPKMIGKQKHDKISFKVEPLLERHYGNDMKSIESSKSRKHILLDHPILSIFLLPLIMMAVVSVSSLIPTLIVHRIETDPLWIYAHYIIISFLIAFLHRIWIRPYRGMLSTENFWSGFLMLLPLTLLMLINLYQPTEDQELSARTVLMGCAPGFMEEVVFRGTSLSNYMRCLKQKSGIRKGVLISSLVFGLFHMTNIIFGADPVATIMQVAYAIGIGFLLGAVFIRTGTLLPCIVAHSLIDITAFTMVDLADSGGMLAESSDSSVLVVLIGMVYFVWGLWLIRNEKLSETVDIWRNKMYCQNQENPDEKNSCDQDNLALNAKNEKGEGTMKQYVCSVCGYTYDPEIGDPEHGIAPGTAFEDLPEDWTCPLCGVGKEDFEEA